MEMSSSGQKFKPADTAILSNELLKIFSLYLLGSETVILTKEFPWFSKFSKIDVAKSIACYDFQFTSLR